jgi:hypothetical protein
MYPREPIAPKSNNPTMSELQQYHLDLKQYERALQVWDTLLQSQEAHVDEMEANLLEFDEDDIECACGFAEMTDGCDCEWCDQLRDEVDSGEGDCATAYYKWSQTTTHGPEKIFARVCRRYSISRQAFRPAGYSK